MSDDIETLLARKKAALLAALAAEPVVPQISAPESALPSSDIHTTSTTLDNDSTKEISKAQRRRQRAKENKKLLSHLHSTWKGSEIVRKEEVLAGVTLYEDEKEQTPSKLDATKMDDLNDFESTLLDDVDLHDEENGPKMTKKERRQQNLVKVAHLKQIAPRPELVEPQDVTAQDPHFLVFLKAYPNSVPVPVHWSQKRKFLDNKKGIEKPAYVLPKFIEDTGISQMRPNTEDEQKSLRKEMRERARPKLGRLDIDYTILHDAFFVHQTKPPLSQHGEVYYECKEMEDPLKALRPGRPLSAALLSALGLAEATPATPPPWLTAMQTFGPPPGYPHVRVPGVNAPLPAGAQWGVGVGEWGRPPTDSMGKGRWGEVFGSPSHVGVCGVLVEHPLQARRGPLWAQLQRGEAAVEDEEALAIVPTSEPAELQAVSTGGEDHTVSLAHYANTEEAAAALATSVGTGGAEGAGLGGVSVCGERQLYAVLEQRDSSVGNAQFGTTFVYAPPPAAARAEEGASQAEGSVAASASGHASEAAGKRKLASAPAAGEAVDSEKEVLTLMLQEEERRKKRRLGGDKLDIDSL